MRRNPPDLRSQLMTALKRWLLARKVLGSQSPMMSRLPEILPSVLHCADFNLGRGCFGTDIIRNCTKLSNIKIHELIFGPIFAKFDCASFSIQKNGEKWQYGPKKHKHVVFRKKKSLRSYMPHTKLGKNKCSDIVCSKLISLIIYN